MPFGAVAAVFAWNRVGAFLAAVVTRLALAPTFRYVDDYFGASADGIYWTGGRCLSVLGSLLGFLCDGEKDNDGVLEMVILGVFIER